MRRDKKIYFVLHARARAFRRITSNSQASDGEANRHG
jgi:hypothetical protein